MNPNESTGQPQSPFFQYLNSVKSTMMKDESTGQQQPEALSFADIKRIDGYIREQPEGGDFDLYIRLKRIAEKITEYERKDKAVLRAAYDDLENRWLEINHKYAELESLSRWREISVDGLPGEGDDYKPVEFICMEGSKVTSVESLFWINHQHYFGRYERNFTHWRPIDLPTP